MKTILLFVFALVTIGSVARADEFIKIDDSFSRLFPDFIANNESDVYTTEYNEDYVKLSYTIYNEELNPVKTIYDNPTRYDYKIIDFYGDTYIKYRHNEIYEIDIYTGFYEGYATFSQTLFNDDDLYEFLRFLRPIYRVSGVR